MDLELQTQTSALHVRNLRRVARDPKITHEAKMELTANFILHRRRARRFYSKMNNITPDSVVFCFDMMENQILPKTPICAAYYSRQMYLYVFGVIRHRGKGSHRNKEDVSYYTWLECENRKNSNMITSALQHCFYLHREEIS